MAVICHPARESSDCHRVTHDRNLLWDALSEGLSDNLDSSVLDLRPLFGEATFNEADTTTMRNMIALGTTHSTTQKLTVRGGSPEKSAILSMKEGEIQKRNLFSLCDYLHRNEILNLVPSIRG